MIRLAVRRLCGPILLGLLGFSHSDASLPASQSTLTPNVLLDLKFLTEVASPAEGDRVALTIRHADVQTNRVISKLWVLSRPQHHAELVDVGDPSSYESSPRWTRAGDMLYYLSDRSGTAQVWRVSVPGGKPEQVTQLPVSVEGFAIAPRGDRLVVALRVFRNCASLECTAERSAAQAGMPATFDDAPPYFWDAWHDDRVLLPYLVGTDREERPSETADPLVHDAFYSMGSPGELGFLETGSALYFTAAASPTGDPTKANRRIAIMPLGGARPTRFLALNDHADAGNPVVSADGKTLAYLSTDPSGDESGKVNMVLLGPNSGSQHTVAGSWDRSPDQIEFSGRNSIVATAGDLGQVPLWQVTDSSDLPLRLTTDGTVTAFSVATNGIWFIQEDLEHPPRLFFRSAKTNHAELQFDPNAEAVHGIVMGRAQALSFPGWHGEQVHAYLVSPPNPEPGKHYPLLLFIHGGPKLSTGNSFHPRLNLQLYAAAGFAVLAIDVHGSSGYGQQFMDSVDHDWGGKPLEDLRQGVAYAVAHNSWIDPRRACAFGQSYGGYMINWIESQWPDGFQCLVNHAGIADTRMFYYDSDAFTFVDREFGGEAWTDPELLERQNPIRLVDQWHTPMLLLQGGIDFRVPYAQSVAAFTALRRRHIDARLVMFPTEGHHILAPRDTLQWMNETLSWITRWTAAGDSARVH